MPRARLIRLTTIAACLAITLLAQQPPLDVESSERLEKLTFQVFAPTPGHTFAVEQCPESDEQCAVIRTDRSGPPVSMTYELDAAPLRGKRIRFSASLLVDYPALSLAQLFMRVDRPAGVGFHEYSPRRRDPTPGPTTREIIATVEPDAKRITIGMRFSGLGAAYLAQPVLEAVSD